MARGEALEPEDFADEAARAAGVTRRGDLTLSDIDRRRSQLWTVSLFVVTAIAVAVALLWLGADLLPEPLRLQNQAEWILVVLVLGLALAFLVYVFEKERSLRHLTDLLVEERVAKAALSTRLEEQEQLVARLEELDRLKSDFVATVSHELKTPLTAIIGAAKTVTSGARVRPDQHAGFMEIIERQGSRLLRLVEDVLTTAHIEAASPRLRRERVDLKDVFGSVILELRNTTTGAGREIELHCDPQQPVVWGDATAIRQIATNLIENALKYSDPPSKVSVSLREEPSSVVLEVVDRGRGVAADEIEIIFDRFRQVDAASTRQVGGFGLGLYIVKSLVEEHRGHIEVESAVGVGSTFRVHLPKRAADQASR